MSTVTALQSFVGRLSKDKLGPSRVETHSEFPNQPSVFPGKVLEQGRSIQVVKGQNFDSNHEVVRAFPSMFGQVDLVHPPIEQATAAPGEKRGK